MPGQMSVCTGMLGHRRRLLVTFARALLHPFYPVLPTLICVHLTTITRKRRLGQRFVILVGHWHYTSFWQPLGSKILCLNMPAQTDTCPIGKQSTAVEQQAGSKARVKVATSLLLCPKMPGQASVCAAMLGHRSRLLGARPGWQWRQVFYCARRCQDRCQSANIFNRVSEATSPTSPSALEALRSMKQLLNDDLPPPHNLQSAEIVSLDAEDLHKIIHSLDKIESSLFLFLLFDCWLHFWLGFC